MIDDVNNRVSTRVPHPGWLELDLLTLRCELPAIGNFSVMSEGEKLGAVKEASEEDKLGVAIENVSVEDEQEKLRLEREQENRRVEQEKLQVESEQKRLQLEIDNLRIEIDKHSVVPNVGRAKNDETLKLRREFQARLEVALNELAALVERTRVRAVQREAIESGFILFTSVSAREHHECPVCLQIPECDPTSTDSSWMRCMNCAEQYECTDCSRWRTKVVNEVRAQRDAAKARGDAVAAMEYDEEYERLNCCPICFASFPKNRNNLESTLRGHVKNGNDWAMCELADNLFEGRLGRRNVREAAQLWTRAAKLNNANGLSKLAGLWQAGCPENNMPQSLENAWHYGLQAARMGHPIAQMMCAIISSQRQQNEEAIQWFSLAAAQNSGPGMYWMGKTFDCNVLGIKRDIFKALYWYRKAAIAKFGVSRLPQRVLEAKRSVFDGSDDIVGYSAIPESLFWANSKCNQYDDRILFPEIAEKCACCGKRSDLFTCGQCKAVKYCDKKCQKKHWKMGHKFDCLTEEKKKQFLILDGLEAKPAVDTLNDKTTVILQILT
jgi:TPR repeat protein